MLRAGHADVFPVIDSPCCSQSGLFFHQNDELVNSQFVSSPGNVFTTKISLCVTGRQFLKSLLISDNPLQPSLSGFQGRKDEDSNYATLIVLL